MTNENRHRRPGGPAGARTFAVLASAALSATLVVAGCGGDGGGPAGEVKIDGSSTVFPVAEAVAEEFQIENRDIRVTVGLSGTGGGMKRFCAGETDVSNASRRIKDSEREVCDRNGVKFVEVPVAWDGLSVVVNPANDFCDCLTVEELRRIWRPESDVETWSDVRREWPGEEIKLYGPGTDSGTFDYFTGTIVGEEDASRADYQASEDDNVLVQGVAGDRYALGYFGYAYYEENRDKLKVLGVDGGDGCVEPTTATIESGEYAPLSRPLFIYLSVGSLERPEVMAFAEFFMNRAPELVPPTGYIPLSEARYRENLDRIRDAVATTPAGDTASGP